MIKLIVDSTCDIEDNILLKHDIKMIPLTISLGDISYLDKVTIRVDEVYEAMKNNVYPQTSQPNPAQLYKLFKNYASQGLDFIYLSFSSKLSGTYQLSYTIMQKLKDEYPHINMETIDTKSGSTAIGLILLQAIKLIDYGHSFEAVTKILKELIQHVEHIFTITNLNWLIKGGRISRSQGMLGNILDIKPILHVNDGIMEVTSKVRGSKKSLHSVAEIVKQRISEFPDQIIGISHADDIETALQLQNILIEKLGDRKFIINKIGSVLGSHLGIGGVGVFFFNQKPSTYLE